MKYLQPPSLQLHAGTNCHTWRSDNPQHLFEGKNKFAAETTARAKKEKKASLEKTACLALSIPGTLPGKMLFIHITRGEVIPRGGPDLACYLPPQDRA